MARPLRLAETANAFIKGYAKKTSERRKAIDKALRLLEQDLHYPSLRARKMEGHPSVWEAHASQSVVMTFDFIDQGAVRLRACCSHDIYRNP